MIEALDAGSRLLPASARQRSAPPGRDGARAPDARRGRRRASSRSSSAQCCAPCWPNCPSRARDPAAAVRRRTRPRPRSPRWSACRRCRCRGWWPASLDRAAREAQPGRDTAAGLRVAATSDGGSRSSAARRRGEQQVEHGQRADQDRAAVADPTRPGSPGCSRPAGPAVRAPRSACAPPGAASQDARAARPAATAPSRRERGVRAGRGRDRPGLRRSS